MRVTEQTAPTIGSRLSGRTTAVLGALLVVATLAAYAPAVRGPFIWDDDVLVTNNPLVQSAGGILRAWTGSEGHDYIPLTNALFWLEWRLFDARPAGYHVVNIFLHILSALLLWRVLERLMGRGAWAAALIFALHPVAVASAAWIAEGKNTLSMALYLGALLAWLRYGADEGRRYYAASLILFLLALTAKASVVVLPPILLLCRWWQVGRITRKDLWRTMPFFALALATGLMAVWFQNHRAIMELDPPSLGVAGTTAATGWIIWFYIGKALLPVNLTLIYPLWTVDGSSPLAFLPLALLLGVLAVCWRFRATWGRGPLTALLYVIIALSPVLGIIPMAWMNHSLVADHFQYLALPGVIALGVGGVVWIAGRRRGLSQRAPAILLAIVMIFGTLIWECARLYAHPLNLWAETVERNDKSFAGWYNYGVELTAVGDRSGAVQAYTRCIELNPGHYAAFDNRGCLYDDMGRYDEAIADFTESIRWDYLFANAYKNRAVAFWHAGRYARAWEDVRMSRRLGMPPHPGFVRELTRDSGMTEAGP